MISSAKKIFTITMTRRKIQNFYWMKLLIKNVLANNLSYGDGGLTAIKKFKKKIYIKISIESHQ